MYMLLAAGISLPGCVCVYQSVMPRLVDYFVVCGLHSAELEQDVLPSECDCVCVCVCVCVCASIYAAGITYVRTRCLNYCTLSTVKVEYTNLIVMHYSVREL